MKKMNNEQMNAVIMALQTGDIDQLNILLDGYDITIKPSAQKEPEPVKMNLSWGTKARLAEFLNGKVDEHPTARMLRHVALQMDEPFLNYYAFLVPMYPRCTDFIQEQFNLRTLQMCQIKAYAKLSQLVGMVKADGYDDDEVKEELQKFVKYESLSFLTHIKPSSALKDLYRSHIAYLLAHDIIEELTDSGQIDMLSDELRSFFKENYDDVINVPLDRMSIDNVCAVMFSQWTVSTEKAWKFRKLINEVFRKYF